MTFPNPTDPNNQTDDRNNYANNQQMGADVTQYQQDQASMAADISALHQALNNMAAELANNPQDAGLALMTFFTQILPDVLGIQQDQMNVLADSQNIASDLRSFVTSAQTDFNAGANVTSAQTQDLYDNSMDLSNWTSYLSNSANFPDASNPGKNFTPPLDPTDAGQIQNMVTSIGQQFSHYDNSSKSNKSDWGPDGTGNNWAGQMVRDMATGWGGTNGDPFIPGWFAPPASGANPTSPATQIKAIQGDLQQANSAVSTQATTTQTQEQFFTNQYNQFVGVTNSLQQSFASENTASVNNQKTS